MSRLWKRRLLAIGAGLVPTVMAVAFLVNIWVGFFVSMAVLLGIIGFAIYNIVMFETGVKF